jgi:predicted Zn finger-like uncharacterized protein
MSLITCCPACGTMFKVVPDQLRISEGWVRCGHCAEVFDASAHLQEEEPPAARRAAETEALRRESIGGAPSEPESEGFASSLHTEVPESEGLASDPPDSELIEAAARSLVEHPLDRPFELRREDPAHAQEMQRGDSELPVRTAGPPEPEPALEDLSFVQQARREEVWHRPAMRAGLLLLFLTLGALLVLQIALKDRDRLAAANPGLRPWLARLCEPLRCTIRPPRQIDAVAIDSSSFNKLRPDAFRLNVTLKNDAAIDVAMPALELTLTDGQDQPLVRRVVTPEELGPNAIVIPAASEWSGSLGLVVGANEASGRIAGYRLLVFYP